MLTCFCNSNIWAPHRQTDIVRLLGDRYKFSPRLLAIICTEPPQFKSQEKPALGRFRRNLYKKNDIEVATTGMSIDLPRYANSPKNSPYDDISHYTLAKQMINYQSYDVGAHFLCVGANWIHELKPKPNNDGDEFSEGRQKRLYSWLVLCDDRMSIDISSGFF